jgi:hypothetical protein
MHFRDESGCRKPARQVNSTGKQFLCYLFIAGEPCIEEVQRKLDADEQKSIPPIVGHTHLIPSRFKNLSQSHTDNASF